MSSDSQTVPVSKRTRWTSYVMSGLPILLLLFSAGMKFAKPAGMAEGFAHLGVPEHLALTLGIIELGSVVIYAIPRTAVLGAILLTGYMGGAIMTHLRIGEATYMQVLIGVFVWGGLYLRDPRIRELIPLRR